MDEISLRDITIQDNFWSPRLEISAQHSIFHQWQMLEASGCIDNFRIAAGEKEGFREGWFFADSDATKWLDAAARIERDQHDTRLTALMDDFIALLGRAQCPDGYLFTYNQVHFPGQRWVNLQIEHELYCHGHLIEAGVSHYEATGRTDMLEIARRAADLLVRVFIEAGPQYTPGHEEIEIALLRLWQVSGHDPYRQLARHFLEQRGKTPFFGLTLLKQFVSNSKRERMVAHKRQLYLADHPGHAAFELPLMNEAKRPPFSLLRFFVSGINGKYFQQHTPIRKQVIPVGHSVRFGYLETAQAMLLRSQPDETLLKTMQAAWNHMVSCRMDVSGGLGALPDLEGFGNDYELNPETAYNETCAALSGLFWNWQMALLSGDAKYTDLFEWQLYNAAAVGMGLSGENYLYNNPLLCRGGITRQPWYSIPCCPSNLSRTYADLARYIFSSDRENLWVHQYFGCQAQVDLGEMVNIKLQSGLPWQGNINMQLKLAKPHEFIVWVRIPSWAKGYSLHINGQPVTLAQTEEKRLDDTASGVDPRRAVFLPLQRKWMDGDEIQIDFGMPITALRAHSKVIGLRGMTAITRGPLLYCLESQDNPNVGIFNCQVDLTSIMVEKEPALLGGIDVLRGCSSKGEVLTFIPYALWGNRGESCMAVWVREK